ncbi:MAG: ester cyclase [Acidobacteriota bacterium]
MAKETTTESAIDIGKAAVLDYNKKDWDAARANMAPGYVYDEVATRRRVKGVDEALAIWRGWAAAFPDSQGEISTAIQSGDTVVVEITWRGTHTGPLETPRGTVSPTGKRIEIRACQIHTIANGRIQTTRHYFDMATLAEQLGVTR